ncbi:MAG: hypothetical protein FWD88_04875 [Treponema sp.]|nr:hypothetical protein [Treponema sp.]
MKKQKSITVVLLVVAAAFITACGTPAPAAPTPAQVQDVAADYVTIIVDNNSPYAENAVVQVFDVTGEMVEALLMEPGQPVTFSLYAGYYAVVVTFGSREFPYIYPPQYTEEITTTHMSGAFRLNFDGQELLRN